MSKLFVSRMQEQNAGKQSAVSKLLSKQSAENNMRANKVQTVQVVLCATTKKVRGKGDKLEQ